jgi:hypothetical protein
MCGKLSKTYTESLAASYICERWRPIYIKHAIIKDQYYLLFIPSNPCCCPSLWPQTEDTSGADSDSLTWPLMLLERSIQLMDSATNASISPTQVTLNQPVTNKPTQHIYSAADEMVRCKKETQLKEIWPLVICRVRVKQYCLVDGSLMHSDR